jgi:hypothetical protein
VGDDCPRRQEHRGYLKRVWGVAAARFRPSGSPVPWLGWLALSLAGVAAGFRFFPRYYFLLLPVMVIAGARGLALLDGKWKVAALALLLIPLARFARKY